MHPRELDASGVRTLGLGVLLCCWPSMGDRSMTPCLEIESNSPKDKQKKLTEKIQDCDMACIDRSKSLES